MLPTPERCKINRVILRQRIFIQIIQILSSEWYIKVMQFLADKIASFSGVDTSWEHSRNRTWIFFTSHEPSGDFVELQIHEWSIGCKKKGLLYNIINCVQGEDGYVRCDGRTYVFHNSVQDRMARVSQDRTPRDNHRISVYSPWRYIRF